jgi:hypothetical protein
MSRKPGYGSAAPIRAESRICQGWPDDGRCAEMPGHAALAQGAARGAVGRAPARPDPGRTARTGSTSNTKSQSQRLGMDTIHCVLVNNSNRCELHELLTGSPRYRPTPRFRSSRRSCRCSIPIDKRISPSPSPAFLRSYLGIEAWVMTANDSTPPRLSAIMKMCKPAERERTSASPVTSNERSR